MDRDDNRQHRQTPILLPPKAALIFRLCRCHFHFRAAESVYFPPGKAGNILRGALGTILRFEDLASAEAARPSGLGDPPKPFVFRAGHLDGKRFAPDQFFSLDVNIFDRRGPLFGILTRAFSEWTRTGLGPRRGRVDLVNSTQEDVIVDLESGQKVSKCSLLFHTPTELKGNPSRDEMPFGVLFSRVRDRVATLANLYGEGPLPVDFQGLSERANRVRTVRSELRYQDVQRQSSRTGAVHGIGGVTGRVDYEGDLTEFVSWLRAAWWTGVGRHTVWGNGAIEVADVE
jgi:hypothetical protein